MTLNDIFQKTYVNVLYTIKLVRDYFDTSDVITDIVEKPQNRVDYRLNGKKYIYFGTSDTLINTYTKPAIRNMLHGFQSDDSAVKIRRVLVTTNEMNPCTRDYEIDLTKKFKKIHSPFKNFHGELSETNNQNLIDYIYNRTIPQAIRLNLEIYSYCGDALTKTICKLPRTTHRPIAKYIKL